jgi:3-hydroxyisobutyrate dehydrogenase
VARIGIAGLGRMGSAMAERLMERGHALTVWNRTPEKAGPLVERGAAAAASPAALAGASEVILTILSDAAAIEGVYGGPEGVLSTDLTGRTVLEMSTVRPETQMALAGRVRARGGAHLECPVGGTTGPARQGRLLGVAGGEADDFARLRPILDDLCRRVEHVGPTGAGASMKLAINLPLMVYYQALGEALTLCRHLGHDPAWLMDLLADTSGAPTMLKGRASAIALALSGGDPRPATVDLDLMRKDLSTMLAEARARGAELPLVARALEVYDDAAAAGWGDRDAAAVPAWWPSRFA